MVLYSEGESAGLSFTIASTLSFDYVIAQQVVSVPIN
jgi:hypothetical protein